MLADELDRIGPLRGREAEQAELHRRIAELRSEAGQQLAEAAEPVKAVREGYESELSGRRAEFSPRRQQAGAMQGQVDALAESSVRRPAEHHASRLRLDAAEARLDWQTTRAAERAPVQELTGEERAAARRIARAYEITEGDALAKAGVIPEPDPKVATELRGLATRDAILKRAQAVAPTERVRPPTLADSPTLSNAEKAVARSAEAVFEAEAPAPGSARRWRRPCWRRRVRRPRSVERSRMPLGPPGKASARLPGNGSGASWPLRRSTQPVTRLPAT